MANWSRPAIIEELLIYDADAAGTIANESKIDLSGGFINFEYYESLFSPHITAHLIYVDTGNSAKGSGDVQERIGEIFNSSTNFKGKKMDIRISHESLSTGLNLADYPLEVIAFNPLTSKDKVKSYLLFMASEYATKNENTKVRKKYSNSIFKFSRPCFVIGSLSIFISTLLQAVKTLKLTQYFHQNLIQILYLYHIIN